MPEPQTTKLTEGVEITIAPKRVGKQLTVTIYEVEIIDKREPGSWHDTLGSDELLQAYISGLVAGAEMIGRTPIAKPPIPRIILTGD